MMKLDKKEIEIAAEYMGTEPNTLEEWTEEEIAEDLVCVIDGIFECSNEEETEAEANEYTEECRDIKVIEKIIFKLVGKEKSRELLGEE